MSAGRAARSAAHLTALRRVSSGRFDVADAVPLAAVERGEATVAPALAAIPEFPVQRLEAVDVRRATSGLEVVATVDGEWGALVSDATGTLVAVAERKGARWQPRVVLRDD